MLKVLVAAFCTNQHISQQSKVILIRFLHLSGARYSREALDRLRVVLLLRDAKRPLLIAGAATAAATAFPLTVDAQDSGTAAPVRAMPIEPDSRE